MIIKKIGKLATGIVLLLGTSLTSSSWAGSQIYYGKDGGGDEDTHLFIFPQGSVPVSAGKVTGGIIKPLGVTLLSSPSSGSVHCKDIVFPVNQTDSEIYHNLINSGKSYDGKPLFKTSIEGIYVTVEVLNYSSPGMEFTPSSFTLPATGEVVIAGRITDASKCKSDQPISFQVRTTYYLGDNYVPLYTMVPSPKPIIHSWQVSVEITAFTRVALTAKIAPALVSEAQHKGWGLIWSLSLIQLA